MCINSNKELTCRTEYLAEAATQTDTCWCKNKNNNTEWEALRGAEHTHKSTDVSQAFPHLWHIICFNKSLSVWPWFESAHSSKVISPTSPLDLCTGLQRKPCVCVCVCVIMCVSDLCVSILPCKFLAQVVWLWRVKFDSEEQSVWRPV